MDAIALFFSKFSEELVGAEFALLCGVSAAAIYLLLIRKKKKESAEWVPAALVRAYLDKARADEADIRYRLFGEAMPVAGATTVVTSNDPALAGQIDALRAQLGQADQRAMEFDRMLNGLRAEKSALEQKLAAAATAAPVAAAGAGGTSPEVQKQLDDLKAKLQEYEVIEDDLANLKKFQKENEALRVKVEQYEKGGAATVVAGAAPAAPTEVKISGGAPQQGAELKIVSGGAAPAPAETPKATETNTDVLQPVTPTVDAAPASAPAPAAAPEPVPAPAPAVAAAPAPAPAPAPEAAAPAAAAPAATEKSPKEKEAELLSEFEKMLAS